MSTDNHVTGRGDEGDASGHDPTADLLSQALHEEAAMVSSDPAALHEIQSRTSGARSPRRSWLYAGVGAAAATAAVIAGVAIVSDSSDPSSGPAPATQGASTDSAPTVAEQEQPTPMAYVGTQTHALFGEMHPAPVDDNIGVMNAWLSSTPQDPDYTTGWPAGVRVETTSELEHGLRMDLTGPASADVTRDPGLGTGGGELAIGALLLNGNFQTGEGVSEVTYNGDSVPTLLGASLPFTLPAYDQLRPLIAIADVTDGQTLSSPVSVDVLARPFEGTVNWTLLDDTGAKVDEAYVTAPGGMATWSKATIDLGALDPGSYTIRCFEYSAEDGSVVNLDDKTFSVQ